MVRSGFQAYKESSRVENGLALEREEQRPGDG